MTLHELGLKYGTDKATWHEYCDFYEDHIPHDNIGTLLEIGVKDGASIKMWRDFYPDAVVIGLDINEPLKIEGASIFKVNCDDDLELEQFSRDLTFDLIIDDGSHTQHQQQTCFGVLWERLKSGGVYIIEDVHTSHYESYNLQGIPTTLEWYQNGFSGSLLIPDEYADEIKSSVFYVKDTSVVDSMSLLIYKK